MATSRYFAATDAIVAVLKATGLTVWDGPVVTGDYSASVFIGYDGDPEGDFIAAALDQEWAGIGAKARSESINVMCAVIVQSGNSDTKSARDKAQSILSTVETTLRADPSIGQTPPPFYAGVQPLSVHQELFSNGIQVRIVFQIAIRTRV